MSDEDRTLHSILFNDSAATGAAVLMQGVRQRMPTLVATWSSIQLTQVSAAIGDQVAKCFDITLGSVLAQGWSDAQKVREALDPVRTPPQMSRSIPLANHKIDWSTQPTLVITIDGKDAVQLPFELTLTFVIDVAVLTIRNSKLYEANLGDYHAEAQIRCGQLELYKYTTKERKLPGTLHSAAGIPLRRGAPS
jgi:hypothetical protein